MATQDQLDQEGNEFKDAFNAPDPDTQEQTEDEAFGITPEVSADTDSGEGEPAAVTVEEPAGEGTAEPEAPAEGDTPAEEAAETPAEEGAEPAAEQAMEAEAGTEVPSQQEKSWEGRLRKREEELAAREAALREKESALPSGTDSPAEEAAEGEPGEGVTAEQAIAKLAEDFGDEFVGMIVAIATAKAQEAAAAVAGESVNGVTQNVDSIIAHLRSRAAREHFKEIFDKHPDFQELHATPEFESFIVAMPEDQQADARRVLGSGSAGEVNDLLDAYKASMNQTDNSENEAADDALDDAEGVRSGGIRLPESPAAGADDYEAAWQNA